ncbi:hypothetical protein F5Y12DRAFT_716290 [Xylaria sp. FL1777]|nr:hypothetical protein F5Y12DRAFT_716290 [Xylaria sp. FL1777]
MDVSQVFFQPSTMYLKNLPERARIARLVVAQAPPGAVSATVVNGWHSSQLDPRKHCTVDYHNAYENMIGRQHIVEPANGEKKGMEKIEEEIEEEKTEGEKTT